MSTERELAGGPAQLHTLPLTFSPDLGTALQLNSAVGIMGKVYGKCEPNYCHTVERNLFSYQFLRVIFSCTLSILFFIFTFFDNALMFRENLYHMRRNAHVS